MTAGKAYISQIGDALVKLKYPYGGFLDGIRMFSPDSQARIIGPAITVKMVESSDRAAPALDKHFVDHNEDGGVMYIQQPKDLPSACWGGLMSTRAKFLGANGVVIDGRMRDINEHKEMKFPVCVPLETRSCRLIASRCLHAAILYWAPTLSPEPLW